MASTLLFVSSAFARRRRARPAGLSGAKFEARKFDFVASRGGVGGAVGGRVESCYQKALAILKEKQTSKSLTEIGVILVGQLIIISSSQNAKFSTIMKYYNYFKLK